MLKNSIMKKKLIEKHKWLNIVTSVEEYVSPNYYNRILKDYIFDNKTDLQIFENWLDKNIIDECDILELGCGSGRTTEILIDKYNNKISSFDMLDLSNQMLDFCKNKFLNKNKLSYINSDTINYLENSKNKYDLVFSLWSYSHSIHQILSKLGLKDGKKYIKTVIKKFIIKNLKYNGKIFIIHFDSMSDEQKILIKQWKKVFPIFENTSIQSPSLILTKEIFEELQNEKIIEYKLEHYIGKEIIYKDEEEALETFMNFHLESYFNESELVSSVLNQLKKYFTNFTNEKKQIIIKPGCFIFEVRKNDTNIKR